MLNYYRYQYNINAYIRDENGKLNGCLYYVNLCLSIDKNQTFLFRKFDSYLEDYFSGFYQKVLNDQDLFIGVKMSMENIGDVLYNDLKRVTSDNVIRVNQLEIYESVLRIYMVSDRILIPSCFSFDNVRRYRKIQEYKEKFLNKE